MDQVRLGIVGMGGRGIGFAHLALQNPLCKLAAFADNNLERARRAAHNLGVEVAMYPSIDELIARGAVDGIIIATPDYLHKEMALKTFAAGIHLLLEKPIATTVEDGLAILEASRHFDRVLSIGFNLRYHEIVQTMKQLIAEQHAVGTPIQLMSTEYYHGGRTYMARWNRLRKYTGGLFIHKGTHDFDVINWLNQPARPLWVSATGKVNALDVNHLPFQLKPGETFGPNCEACECYYKCPDRTGVEPRDGKQRLFDNETEAVDGYRKDVCIFQSQKDAYDNAMALIEYDNGSRAYHCENFVTQRDNRLYTVIGDRGHIEADMYARTVDLYPRWTRNKITHHVQPVGGGHGGCDTMILDNFLKGILKGEKPLANPVDGVWSLAVAVACEKAMAERRIVPMKEVIDPGLDVLRG